MNFYPSHFAIPGHSLPLLLSMLALHTPVTISPSPQVNISPEVMPWCQEGLPLRMRPLPSEKEPLQQRTYVYDHNIANIAQIFVLRKVTKVFFLFMQLLM